MPLCRCGNEFPEARARLGFDCCLECGKKEAAAELARRTQMIRTGESQIRIHLFGSRSRDAAAAPTRGFGKDAPDADRRPGDRPRRAAQEDNPQALRIRRLGIQARQTRRTPKTSDTSRNIVRVRALQLVEPNLEVDPLAEAAVPLF